MSVLHPGTEVSSGPQAWGSVPAPWTPTPGVSEGSDLGRAGIAIGVGGALAKGLPLHHCPVYLTARSCPAWSLPSCPRWASLGGFPRVGPGFPWPERRKAGYRKPSPPPTRACPQQNLGGGARPGAVSRPQTPVRLRAGAQMLHRAPCGSACTLPETGSSLPAWVPRRLPQIRVSSWPLPCLCVTEDSSTSWDFVQDF